MDNSDLKYDDEIDLRNILGMLWISKTFIASLTILITILFYISSIFLEDQYTSRIVVVTSENNDGMNMFSEYSGIASMAGINLPQQTVNNKELALEVMQSVDFFERLYKEESFSAELMVHLQYDPVTTILMFDEEFYNPQTNNWKLGNSGKSLKPPLIAAYGKFHEDFFRITDGSQTFIKIGVTHVSPHVAEKWVRKICSEINLILKERDKIEAEKSLAFLKDRLARGNIPVLEKTLSVLATQEMQKLMLSEISENYVFKIVESARVPAFPSSPDRSLMLILGALIGFTLSVMAILIMGFYSRKIINVQFIPPSIKLEEKT